MAPGAERPITSACLVVDGEILRDRPSASPSQEGVDQAGFVRLDAAILGDFALDGLGRVSTSLRFACVRSTVGARGPRDILCFPGHGRLLRRGSRRNRGRADGCPPSGERRSVVVERAFADRNNLKASVAAVLVILAGEASGLLASIGFGFVETRLKVCADGGIAVDAADAFPFSDAVNLIGHGLPSSPMGVEKDGEAEASPDWGEQSERDVVRVVAGRLPLLLWLSVLVVTVVRALAQALDAFGGECDPVDRFSLLLPFRLAHRARGEDEIALNDVALDVAAGGLAEDGDFVPTGAIHPFAAIVLAAVARRDVEAQGRTDLPDFADPADDREFRNRVHGFIPLSISSGLRLMPSVPRVRLKGSRASQASTREARAGRSVERRTAEGGDFVARGIRPLGRRGKSSNAAVAARLVRLHGRPENPRDRTGHVRNPSIPVSCSLLAFPLLHFSRLFCVNRSILC